MDSTSAVHPDPEQQAVLQEILQVAVRARVLFPRGGFDGLEANTVQVLLSLAESDGRSVAELVDRLLLGQSTISTALGVLKDRGLATDSADGSDGRRRLQTITPRGRALVTRFCQRAALDVNRHEVP